MLSVKEFGVLGGACAVVLAAAAGVVGAHQVDGLIHERNHLRDQVQALQQLPHRTAPPPPQPSTQPTAPAAAPAPSSSAPTPTSTPTPAVLRVVARSTPSSPAPSPTPGSPAPSPTPTQPRCATGSVATVRIPAGLPCNTAVLGGSG